MAKYSEIPKGYELRGETKERKYAGRKYHSPKQIADRVGNPKESSGAYKNRAEFNRAMGEMADRGSSEGIRESNRHRQKSEVYELLAKKAKPGKAYQESTHEGNMGKLNYELDRLFDKWKAEDGLVGTVAMISLVSGICFMSANITGNAISNLSTNIVSLSGAGLFIVGIVAGFLWIRKKS